MNLTHKVHHGVKWTTASIVFSRATRFLTTIILARILLPEMFGLMALANVVIETMRVIKELGFGAAYIQRQDDSVEVTRLAANTTFYIGLFFNVILFAAGMALSGQIAMFFNYPELKLILQVMFTAFLLDAVSTVPDIDLQKRLEFGKLATVEIVRSIANMIISILLVFNGFEVWSLVIGYLGSHFIYVIMLFKISGWRPRWEFSKSIALELFTYGKFIWAFVILSAIGGALDKTLVGKFYGAEELGYYGMAFHLCNLPAAQISSFINRITFPVYSKINKDIVKLKAVFLKTVSHTAILSLPIAFGLLAIARPLVVTLYGEKWEPMIPLIGILAFYGMTLSLSSVSGSIFKAIGKPSVLLYTSINHHVFQIIFLFLFKDFGVIGICYAVLLPILISSLIAFILILKYLNISFTELVEPILRPGLSAVGMFALIKLFENYINFVIILPINILFVAFILIGIVFYIIISRFTNKTFFFEFKDTIQGVLVSKGN